VVRAIVATVTENFPELPAVRLSGLGDTEQLDDAGAPVQAKFTLPEKPESAVAVKLNVAVAPAATVADEALAAIANPVEPLPLR
jgi:hypothetical protein